MNKIRILVNNRHLFCETTVPSFLQAKYFTFCLKSKENINFYQQIRWRKTPVRKPSWLPPSKTKLFYIPKHPDFSEEESEEIKRLFCHYHTYMKAVTNYFKLECEEMSATGHLTIAKAKVEQEEFEKLLDDNKKENERVAILREGRVAKELEEKQQHLLNIETQHSIWLEKKKMEIENLVRREKELSKTYVTLENLDEVIEKCLSDVVNYNFAIDLDGRILWESTPHPTFSPYREKKNL